MNQTSNSLQAREARAQIMWTAFILSFFLIQAVVWTVAISVTANDPSHAVVPDYDQKAQNWSDQMKLQAASDRLNWQSSISVEGKSDLYGNQTLTVRIQDEQSQPVEGAVLELMAFHTARASQVQTFKLTESEPGVYRGQIRVRKTGNWQIDGTATRNSELLLIDQRIWIQSAG